MVTYNIYTREVISGRSGPGPVGPGRDLKLVLSRDQLIEFQLAIATCLRLKDTHQGISISNELNLYVEENE